MRTKDEMSYEEAMQGIRAVAVEIGAICEAGQVDQTTVASLRKKAKDNVFTVRRSLPLVRQREDRDEKVGSSIHGCIGELLEVLGEYDRFIPRAKMGTWPAGPVEQLCYSTYTTVEELLDWVTRVYGAYLIEPVMAPEKYTAVAMHQIGDRILATVDRLLARDADPMLVDILMQCFRTLLRESIAGTVTYQMLMHVQKLHDEMFIAAHEPDTHDINTVLRDLLWSLNINTRQAVAYSKRFIQSELDAAGSPHARADTAAYYSKLLQGFEPEADYTFEQRHDPLAQQLLRFIELKNIYPASHAATVVTPTTAGDDSGQIRINMPNEHYAAWIRAQREGDVYIGSYRSIARDTGRVVLSKNGIPLGIPTHEQNIKNPNHPAVLAAWALMLRILTWMIENWANEHGLPNLFKMNGQQLQDFFSNLKASSRYKKRRF